MKILITGINGLIGQILYNAFKNKHDIYGIDLHGNNCYKADISIFEDLDRAFNNFLKIDCIIHLAADKSDGAIWELVLKNNIVGTRNVYECAKNHGVKKIIFASSNHVTGGYGYPAWHVNEDFPIAPDGNYGASKAIGEVIAKWYNVMHNISSICLRIGYVPTSDNPYENPKYSAIWLSHRDLIQLFEKALESNIRFGIFHGVSDNKENWLSMERAKTELKYKPRDGI